MSQLNYSIILNINIIILPIFILLYYTKKLSFIDDSNTILSF